MKSAPFQDLLLLEQWQTLKTHILFNPRFGLYIGYADSCSDLQRLYGLAKQDGRQIGQQDTLVTDALSTVTQVLAKLRDQIPVDNIAREPFWLDLVSCDSQSIAAEQMRAAMLAKLNEARGWLTTDFARGLVICLPTNWLGRASAIAPDLWHVRSFTLEIRRLAQHP